VTSQSSSPGCITAVVVLYKRAPSASETLCSLKEILRSDSVVASHLSLIIYDNSPEPHESDFSVSIPVLYKHDPTNPGLAAAYNFALDCADQARHEWLLLLDQDTSLTPEFFTELIACTHSLRDRAQVASIVPKLLVCGEIFSPAAHFIDQVRRPYWRTHHAVNHDEIGIQQGRLGAYNSGATLRVSKLISVGGFPKEFWLDYLDHAVFHALSIRGYQMYVMKTELKHDSSQAKMGDVPVWRQRNILLAQTLFVKRTGNFVDRLFYRIWLLRYSRSLRINHPDKRLWKEALVQALRLKG
jgi:GT2 family glycosyltransferase